MCVGARLRGLRDGRHDQHNAHTNARQPTHHTHPHTQHTPTQDYRKPQSQAEPGSFLGFESSFAGTGDNGYPGGVSGLFFLRVGGLYSRVMMRAGVVLAVLLSALQTPPLTPSTPNTHPPAQQTQPPL